MKSKWWIWVVLIIVILAIMGSCDDSSSSNSKNSDTKYEYDVNDKYYRNNDHNNDGKISDKEFQDAVGDWMDDHGY